MSLVFDAQFAADIPSTPGFGMQANGIVVSGAAAPAGVADRIRLSALGLHFTLIEGDTPPTGGGGSRSECYTSAQPLGESWVVADVLIPASGWALRDKGLSIFQLKQTHAADAPTGRGLPIVVLISGGEFSIIVADGSPEVLGLGAREVGSAKVRFDKWHRFCFHTKWAEGATGFREVFCDGVPLLREYACATVHDRAEGPYFKFGIYNFTGFSGYGSRDAYFKNVKIWTGETVGYSRACAPVTPSPIQQLPLASPAFEI